MVGGNVIAVTGSRGKVKLLDIDKSSLIALLPNPPSAAPNLEDQGAYTMSKHEVQVGACGVLAQSQHTVVVQYVHNSLCCWDIHDPSKPVLKWECVGHPAAVVGFCAPPTAASDKSASQVYTTICADGYVRVWRRSPGTASGHSIQTALRVDCKKQYQASACHPVAAMSTHGNMLAVGDANGSVSLYVLPSPTRYRLDIIHDERVSCLAWGLADESEVLASGGLDGRVHTYQIHGARILPLQTIEAESAVTALAMIGAQSPQTLIVGEENGKATMWCASLTVTSVNWYNSVLAVSARMFVSWIHCCAGAD